MHADAVVVNWKTTSLQPDLFKTEKRRQVLLAPFFLIKVPICHIVVELDVIDGTELGDDCQNICLLSGREHILPMMIAVVRAVAATEVTPDTLARLSPLVVRHILVEL